MLFLKTVALALISALANPLCCCVSGSPAPDQEAHACCAKSESDKTEPAAAHQDCPHRTIKASQISQAADTIDPGHRDLAPVALIPLITYLEFEPNRDLAPSAAALREPLPPRANPTAGEYCVYLL